MKDSRAEEAGWKNFRTGSRQGTSPPPPREDIADRAKGESQYPIQNST
jgi:hypothetical protein